MGSINTYPASKTEQILSRYRPIAPKPQLPVNPSLQDHQDPTATPENTQHSSFFKNFPTLQTRPARTRKRGRSGISPATYKRLKSNHSLFTSSTSGTVPSHAKNSRLGLSTFHGLGRRFPQFSLQITPGLAGNLNKPPGLNFVTLPFLPYPSSVPEVASGNRVSELHDGCSGSQDKTLMDLNCDSEIPCERDLLQNLHGSVSATSNGCGKIIAPHPVRPIGSSISVGSITEDPSSNHSQCGLFKKPEEVEAEIESDALPAVVSDSNNRVRLANSAYKEMVGQPECLWLDSMAIHGGNSSGGSASKRISGEVTLNLLDSNVPLSSSNGFSCRARIEWGRNGEKSFVNAPCDVVKLSCKSKDYLFTWRFHTGEAAESNSKV